MSDQQPKDTVWVISSGYHEEDKNYSRGVYHTDKECSFLGKSNLGKKPVDKTKVDHLDLCKHCSDEEIEQEYRYQQCPQCNGYFGNLPLHIRGCDGD